MAVIEGEQVCGLVPRGDDHEGGVCDPDPEVLVTIDDSGCGGHIASVEVDECICLPDDLIEKITCSSGAEPVASM